jgi:hypothetical protein
MDTENSGGLGGHEKVRVSKAHGVGDASEQVGWRLARAAAGELAVAGGGHGCSEL